jgi:hypothetical protein
MALDSGIHVDQAVPLLDQPILESLVIPLDVVMRCIFLHRVAQMPLSQWDDLCQTLGLD